jgi:hypothetical protein
MSEHQLTDTEVAEHVETLKGYIADNHAGLVGAPRGATPAAVPDHALAAAVKLPERPKGMPIGQWLQIIAAIIAAMKARIQADIDALKAQVAAGAATPEILAALDDIQDSIVKEDPIPDEIPPTP